MAIRILAASGTLSTVVVTAKPMAMAKRAAVTIWSAWPASRKPDHHLRFALRFSSSCSAVKAGSGAFFEEPSADTCRVAVSCCFSAMVDVVRRTAALSGMTGKLEMLEERVKGPQRTRKKGTRDYGSKRHTGYLCIHGRPHLYQYCSANIQVHLATVNQASVRRNIEGQQPTLGWKVQQSQRTMWANRQERGDMAHGFPKESRAWSIGEGR